MPKHFFDADIAQKYGISAALIFQNLTFWIKKNAENGTNYHDGKYWTYNPRKQYYLLFPYLTRGQIDAGFKKLIDGGLIIVGRHDRNKYNRTLWYALTSYGESIVRDLSNDSSESTDGETNHNEMLLSYNNYNNIANINTNNAQQSLDSSSKNVMNRYGEFKNVKLSDEDYDRLINDYGKTIANDFIDRLDRNIASKGTRYKSHYATIKEWIIRAVNEGKLNVKASKEIEELEEYVNSIDYSKLAT